MTPDIERVRARREQAGGVIKRNRSAVEKAERKEARFGETLRNSEKALESARETLRDAGILKKR